MSLRDVFTYAVTGEYPPVLPNAGKSWQLGWNEEPECLTPDTKHQYVKGPHNVRGFNYSECATCGLTMYVDSSD